MIKKPMLPFKVFKRHTYGSFDVEDATGNCWRIQLDSCIEEWYQKLSKENQCLLMRGLHDR